MDQTDSSTLCKVNINIFFIDVYIYLYVIDKINSKKNECKFNQISNVLGCTLNKKKFINNQ